MPRSILAKKKPAAAEGRARSPRALLIALVLCIVQGLAAAPSLAMTLGVQTHFAHGWPLALMDKVVASGAPVIRDGMPWGGVEKSPGVYQFPANLDAYVAAAKARKIGVILAITPGNGLYDGGQFVHSPEAQKAFTDYVNAVLNRYGDTIVAVEIGNEINTKSGMSGIAMADRPATYASLLAVLYPAVKAQHPKTAILGGSTNVIGTGFLEEIFKAGALANMDAVVVHPYRSHAEGVDKELEHLDAVMARYRPVRPIYATEFGSEFADPTLSAPHMIKEAAEMSAVHVKLASWYALEDEAAFKNMGLYTADGAPKPALGAFRLIETALSAYGDAVRVDTGDDRTFVYRYGANHYVMWGQGRPITFSGSPNVRSASGEAIPTPGALTDDPIVIDGQFDFKLGANPVLADSLYEFRGPNWSYFAKSPNGTLHPLTLVDWEWTSYMGGKYYKPLRVNADSLAPRGDASHPVQAVERFTPDHDGPALIEGHFSLHGAGDGVDLHILHNGSEIYTAIVTKALDLKDLPVDLHKGDTLDFSVGPNQTAGGDGTALRIRLLSPPAGH
jgi:hypothetical protein